VLTTANATGTNGLTCLSKHRTMALPAYIQREGVQTRRVSPPVCLHPMPWHIGSSTSIREQHRVRANGIRVSGFPPVRGARAPVRRPPRLPARQRREPRALRHAHLPRHGVHVSTPALNLSFMDIVKKQSSLSSKNVLKRTVSLPFVHVSKRNSTPPCL
jgi:hypothetical protein